MQYNFTIKTNSKNLILFFTGWGLTENATAHLIPIANTDILVCSDYSEFNSDILNYTCNYLNITVVGYSMGVWAAAYVMQHYNILPQKCIAINGTLQPVSDQFGIPNQIFNGTATTLNQANFAKFQLRMCGNKINFSKLMLLLPNQNINNLINQLIYIHNNQNKVTYEKKWDFAILSQSDNIFPFENMNNFWKKHSAKIIPIKASHFPFFNFSNWDEIINI